MALRLVYTFTYVRLKFFPIGISEVSSFFLSFFFKSIKCVSMCQFDLHNHLSYSHHTISFFVSITSIFLSHNKRKSQHYPHEARIPLAPRESEGRALCNLALLVTIPACCSEGGGVAPLVARAAHHEVLVRPATSTHPGPPRVLRACVRACLVLPCPTAVLRFKSLSTLVFFKEMSCIVDVITGAHGLECRQTNTQVKIQT